LLGIDISKNSIYEIPSLSDSSYLRYLNCSKNNINNLPILPDSLIELKCGTNKLEKLENLPEELKMLDFELNNIKHVKKFPRKLKELNCSHNPIEYLTLPNNLRYLNCEFNNLKEIPLITDKLKKLECIGNKAITFQDKNAWLTISKFKRSYYINKFGKKLENYYMKNIRNKQINLELLYSPDLDFYKMKWNQVTLKYI
jgi:Leucine-rich repeat (LRR) protein